MDQTEKIKQVMDEVTNKLEALLVAHRELLKVAQGAQEDAIANPDNKFKAGLAEGLSLGYLHMLRGLIGDERYHETMVNAVLNNPDKVSDAVYEKYKALDKGFSS